MKIFSVRDMKADAYMTPFFFPTAGMAVRSFADCFSDEKHMFSSHPEDFALFELGSFDECSGGIVPLDVPRSLGLGIDFIPKSA